MLIHEFITVRREEIINEASYKLIQDKECVRISDDIIVNNDDFLSCFKSHWWYIGNIHEGLDYHGITIILNDDLEEFIGTLNNYKHVTEIQNLISLCVSAIEQDKDIVHFGI